ncbi:hypothetical protein BRI6_1693 [plant metagenome]|uniref:Uncharacterized protein n=1 Tax=plant metagenome TaxID=1297885 RepID=A0A484UFQ8_9ZZZZ
MTTQARIAAFLSTSALCLGLAAGPAAHAAETGRPSAQTSSQAAHGTHASAQAKHGKTTGHAQAHKPAHKQGKSTQSSR